MSKMIDLTGQRFGRLTVNGRAENNARGQACWRCECDCGDECVVLGANLRNGTTKSCGCLHRELQKYPVTDLSGQRFGRLVVLEYSGNSSWRCQCDCGNTCEVSTRHLMNGHTQSCGCLQRDATSEANLIDLTGQRFGHLVVLERFGTDRAVRYRCRCDCGNECIKYRSQLKCGRALSCGCMTQSNGEYYVGQYLAHKRLLFTKQVRFSNLRGLGGRNLSFDFAVNHPAYGRILIEYQGSQHYIPGFNAGLGHFKRQQANDNRKRQAAELLGYPLIEVPYTYDTQEKVNQYLDNALIPLFQRPKDEWEYIEQNVE